MDFHKDFYNWDSIDDKTIKMRGNHLMLTLKLLILLNISAHC